jgi:hypothetical protein
MQHSSNPAATHVVQRSEWMSGAQGATDQGATGAAAQERASCSGVGSSSVQKDTSNASTPEKPQVERPLISKAQLDALGDLQKWGYEKVGKLARVKMCASIPIVGEKVALGITQAGGCQCQGLNRCGSRWCPDCWGKIAKRRGEDIEAVSTWAVEQGYSLVMVTLTAAHITNKNLQEADGDTHEALTRQNVSEIFDGLAAAWRYTFSGRGAKNLGKSAGRVGYARAFELTTDALDSVKISGTHGHFHVLFVLEPGTDLEAYKSILWERWRRGCAKQDLHASEEGYDWKELKIDRKKDAQAAALYLVKGEKLSAKKVAGELARGDQKSSRGENRCSPEGLLRAIGALEGEEWQRLGAKATAQWRGIEEACKGRRWLTWSRDLRNLAGLGEEKSDEELANEVEEVENSQVAVVEYPQVKEHIEEIREAVRDTKKQAEKWDVLLLCLNALGIAYEVSTQEAWGEEIKRCLMARRKQE